MSFNQLLGKSLTIDLSSVKLILIFSPATFPTESVMSESADVLSDADADYGTDTEFMQDEEDEETDDEVLVGEDSPNLKIIKEAADSTQNCRVCYDEYHPSKNQARVLACGHTFCTRCVVGCGTHTNNAVIVGMKCPECRKISDQVPATVPINFQFMQLLTALSLIKLPKTRKQELELPNYENFERLGAHIPINKLTENSLPDLFEHLKAVFNAIRIKAGKEPKMPKPFIAARISSELGKLSDAEKTTYRIINALKKLYTGELPRDYFDFGWQLENPLERLALREDNDWMREMVVYRPPHLREPEPPEPEVPEEEPVLDLDVLLAREELAQAEADPNRNLHVVREAHLRRERESAQERQVAIRNEQLMRDILDWNGQDPAFDNMSSNFRRRHLERTAVMQNAIRRSTDTLRNIENERRVAQGLPPFLEHDDVTVNDRDDESVASDDSSYIDDTVRSPPLPMTIGEGITIYRMIEIFSPRSLRQGTPALALPQNHRNLDALVQTIYPVESSVIDRLADSHLADLRVYGRANKVDVDHLLRCLRQHSIRFASNVVEAPRVPAVRLRRQRPVAADEYNARLRDIRSRAKEALRGNRPPHPANAEEADLTVRLIVNLANSLGVRDKLLEAMLPVRTPEEEENEIFVMKNSGSGRQEVLFCTVCRCDVPVVSKQVHAQGRRHVAAMTNRPSYSRAHH
ncbi:hypothetical protein B9Z55_002213 [Caenorhabditis nigoni]|uniref:RING-type domain-containing protein n=1 Tax=Caenorhabditis nigoni TaxID=1611254 RepID=A0A2G5VJG5_9PELO|nr:hypothetical protein B9Z55_002213 [Caenorhabditis nigoni]